MPDRVWDVGKHLRGGRMTEVKALASLIIGGLGGWAILTLALAGWIGKVWADKIFQAERAKHNQKLTELKAKFDAEILKVSIIYDRANFVSKKQYEKEFQIYSEIWEKLVNTGTSTIALFPPCGYKLKDKEEDSQARMQKYEDYSESYDELRYAIRKYAPFFKKDLVDRFWDYVKLCKGQGKIYADYIYKPLLDKGKDDRDKLGANEKKEAYVITRDKIIEFEGSLGDEIREYLQSLQEL